MGHAFSHRDLLKRALTHSSADAKASNERLEFVGDRVLGLIVAEDLHRLYPDDQEGALALKYNARVRQEACTRAADAAGLVPLLILAASYSLCGGRRMGAKHAGACEAVIAALYEDGGMDAARRFVECYWAPQYADLNNDMRDAKTALQEWAQARKTTPAYELVGREGPDHAPRFAVRVTLKGHDPETGEGGSKREAEQDAAGKMLAKVTAE